MISASDYDFFRRFLKARSGLVLGDDKQYLLESRLGPVIRRIGLASLGQLAARLRENGVATLEQAVVEAMTTNESFFFRDKTPFDTFASTMLPALLRSRSESQTIRIWCAAASTGQEPYSLAMILSEQAAKLAGRRIEIVATDLSSEVLEKAKAGIYTQFEVQRGLPSRLLIKYFDKVDDHWVLSARIRQQVRLQRKNLITETRGSGPFDIVLCRNVVSAFDPSTARAVLEQVAGELAPDGYLVMGAYETSAHHSPCFRPVPGLRGLYRRDPNHRAVA